MAYEENNSELPDTSEEASESMLEAYAEEVNLTTKLDKARLQEIGNKVVSGVVEDLQSQQQWLSATHDALELSKLTKKPKNTPLPQSANIKYPMITTACYQFAARTYPELIQDGKIVKTEVVGRTNPMLELIAEGVSTHMSYQLLGKNGDWEAGVDKLLVSLPNIGFVLKKTYYDSVKKENCSDVCYYSDIILRNDPSIGCINDLRRITHVLHVHPNDLVSGCREGIYDEDAVMEIMALYATATLNPVCDLYEQHTFIDLDDDGYEEPYIVTTHKATNKVLRIYARYDKDGIQKNKKNEVIRITPIQYFTDYHFLPAPDGSYMSVGFGSLMLHMNETVNTILNQLIDAGTLANLQTGFIDSRLKIMGGQMMVDPGQWTKVKGVMGQQLKDGVVPINYKEPSSVLYQLLGTILTASKELTSSTDALAGTQNATNVPATSMLAMIEQGMKLHSAIQRRFYRALKEEYQKIFYLNSKYADQDEIMNVLGPDFENLPDIYKTKTVKVIPVADPNLSSDAQRLSQAQVVMQTAVQPGSLINQYEAQKAMLTAAKVSNVAMLLPPDAKNAPKAPDPKMMDVQAKAQNKQAETQIKASAQALKEKEFAAKLAHMEAQITKLQADSLKSVAQAHVAKQNADINEVNSKVEMVRTGVKMAHEAHKQMADHDVKTAQVVLQKASQDNAHAHAAIAADQAQQDIDNQHEQAMNPPTPPAAPGAPAGA